MKPFAFAGVLRAPRLVFLSAALAALLAAGCGGDSNNDAPPEAPDFVNAGPDGPTATIRRTTSGVPHVTADNLESAAFGLGYAQAQDNVCVLADGFVKARSERAKYFGPGPGNLHIINDFSYLAQGVRTGAEAEFDAMSAEARALIRGFAAGYSKYVRDTDPADLPPECRNGPWVKEIDAIDLLGYYRIVAQYASGDLFATGAVFIAVPPGVDPSPQPVAAALEPEQKALLEATVMFAQNAAGARENYKDLGLASNAWGVGTELSENGKGALLANPHFPYTGLRRLYESQLTVPGYLNVHGAGLLGTALPLINFNENLAWSHTVSTSRRFTVYELTLKPGDPLTYIKDGVEKPITTETYEIDVNIGGDALARFSRTFYFSEYGPMLAMDAVTGGGLPAWGATGKAYTYRDANASTNNLLDTWLEMSQATDLGEFQAVFQRCRTTLWVNSTYADDQGNAFYIDSSSVPNLSDEARSIVAFKRYVSPAYAQLFDNGITLLDGNTSRDDWIEGECGGLVPWEDKPKLVRADFVQNSNDSFWSANPAEPLVGYPPLYGPERTALNPRTRIGLYMLQNPTDPGYAASPPAGQDGKFGAVDLINVIHNNRSWYAEEFLGELQARCAAVGAGPVNLPGGGSRTVDGGCAVLAGWDGVYEEDSVGAHVFRVFIADYRSKFASHLTVPFDEDNPVFTPSTPAPADPGDLANDPMLVSLAAGLDRLDQAQIPYTATLGEVQTYTPTGGVPPGGTPVVLAESTPWHGGDGTIDGAFNAVRNSSSPYAEDTLLPRISPPSIPSSGGLSSVPGQGWPIAYGTSWHFGLEFTDNGPRAFGLVSYSQSTDPDSAFFNDQARRFADKDFRQFWFTEAEIQANLLPGGETTVSDD